MIYVWSRNRWLINGRHLMKVFRWSTKFRPAAGESSLAAVWVSLPLLPVVFFQEELLFSIASVVGRVLAMDGPTRNLTRTNVARVCLEVDLLKELPRRVRIEIGDESFWQDIDYEKLPSFCTVCQQQGHSIEICKLNKKDSVEKAVNLNSNSSLANPSSEVKNGRSSEVLVTQAKHAKLVIGDKTENDQAVGEGSCHLPLNGCSPEELSKMKKTDASDSRGECSDMETTEQSLSLRSNGPSKLSANQVLEKTEDLLKVGTSKVIQDEKLLQGENTLLLVEEEEEEVEEEEEDEKGNCDEDDDLVNIETQRSDKAEENHRGEETESMTNKRKKSPGRTSPSSRRKTSSNKPIFFWKRKQKYTAIRYSYSDVKKMTKSFREVIGRGGSCEVYKGQLPDGRLVAVKVPRFPDTDQFLKDEINIMRTTSHVNIVTLLGFCLKESKRAIVYEFLPNSSLDKFLYPQEGLCSLGDEILHQIAVGVARGLEYLHHGCSTSIVHFDVKPGNILLDQNFCPKICDFGLARLWPNDCTCSVSRIAGTYGYIAPELFREHNFSDKTDVYGYGMTLLEMVVRRKPIDATAREKGLQEWVYRHLYPEGQGYIEGVAVTESTKKMILVGLWCVQCDPVLRPSISRVVQMLEGNINELQIPPNPIGGIPEVAGLIRYSYSDFFNQRYCYSDVKKMTKSFREVIGQGGYGEVYKGELPDGRLVAVKVMNAYHEEFMKEINIVKRTSHVNIVSVLGFCLEEPRRAIVYEFLPNASLDKFLYPQEGLCSIGDEILHQIAVGIARGLEYLHHGCSTSIVHFDIKPGNILLDQNFCPKIFDFGRARLWPNDWTSSVSVIAGTIGYMAPELCMRYKFSDKTDVYGYGMTLLEMVVRRRPIGATTRESGLQEWVYKHLYPEGQGYIEGVAVTESTMKMILVGLWCVQHDPVLRPSISRVVQMLEGNINELQIPPNPSSNSISTASYPLSFEEPRYSREGNYGVNTREVGYEESEGTISSMNSLIYGR